MSVGLRILRRSRKVSPEIIERFSSLPVANVSDSMARMSAGVPTFGRCMQGAGSRAGADGQDSAWRQPDVAQGARPGGGGDVIVVDAGGDLTNSLMGELMLAHAETKRLAGIVIHGAVRDVAYIRSRSLPVFAAGITHRGPTRTGPARSTCRSRSRGW